MRISFSVSIYPLVSAMVGLSMILCSVPVNKFLLCVLVNTGKLSYCIYSHRSTYRYGTHGAGLTAIMDLYLEETISEAWDKR